MFLQRIRFWFKYTWPKDHNPLNPKTSSFFCDMKYSRKIHKGAYIFKPGTYIFGLYSIPVLIWWYGTLWNIFKEIMSYVVKFYKMLATTCIPTKRVINCLMINVRKSECLLLSPIHILIPEWIRS